MSCHCSLFIVARRNSCALKSGFRTAKKILRRQLSGGRLRELPDDFRYAAGWRKNPTGASEWLPIEPIEIGGIG
jgi:hypothetical protein